MKWVMQIPVTYVCSPNTNPVCLRYQSQAGATVCSWAKQAELACSATLWGVACCIHCPPHQPAPLWQIPLHHLNQCRPTAKDHSWPTRFPTIYYHLTLHLPNLHCSGSRFLVLIGNLYVHSVAYDDRP